MVESRPPQPAGPVARALREAMAFDASGLAPVAGLRAALGLSAVLAIGLAAGGPNAAIIAATGALIVGIVSLTGGVRPPLLTMLLTALAQAASIFVGSATGGFPMVHVFVLVGWAFAAALLVALGQGATTVGVQAIVAFVVFGRFAEGPVGAARLGGIALAGAAVQILVVAVVRWPEALGAQRAQLATTLRELSALARGDPDTPSIPAAEAADAADVRLSGVTFLARDDGDALRGLLDESRRVRLSLIALAGLRRRLSDEPGAGAAGSGSVEAALQEVAGDLETAAVALLGRDQGARQRLAEQAEQLSRRGRRMAAAGAAGSALEVAAAGVVASLAGQVRAIDTLVEEVWDHSGTHLQRPTRRRERQSWRQRGRSALEQLAANLTPRSAAFRHAARMAVLVPACSLLGQVTGLGRGYWIPLTVALVLRPDFSGTLTRGATRSFGTIAGVAITGLALATLHPGQTVSVVLIGVLAWAAYSLFVASFAAAVACITAIVILFLGLVSPDTVATAIDRLGDTLIGAALALAAYIAWPTWSADEAWAALGVLVGAQRRYLASVLGRITGVRDDGDAVRARLARDSRLARSNASAVVSRSLAEPRRHRIDGERTAGVLAALRRVSEAVHLLRTQAMPEPGLVPAAAPLAGELDAAMATLSAALQGDVAVSLPALRTVHDGLIQRAGEDAVSRLVVIETDEIVDALDTVGHLLGVGSEAR